MQENYIRSFKQYVTQYLERILKIDRSLIYQSEILYDDKELNLVNDNNITNIKYDDYLSLLYNQLNNVLDNVKQENKLTNNLLDMENEIDEYLKELCNITRTLIDYEIRIENEKIYYIYFCYDSHLYYKNHFDLFKNLKDSDSMILIGEKIYDFKYIEKTDFDKIAEYEKNIDELKDKIIELQEQRAPIGCALNNLGNLAYSGYNFNNDFETLKNLKTYLK